SLDGALLCSHFFLLAIDLLLAMTLSCLFYAFICLSMAFLTCFIIIFSFGIVERNVDVKGRAIVILASNSSIGRMFARNLDKAGFRVSAAHWPPREEGTATEEECSSSVEVAQLHMTEDEHFSSVGFWGLVNNAGISTFGETGWLSMEKYEKFADVNLLGSIRTTLAFLPLLRKYEGNANPPLFRGDIPFFL
uniref:Uncharacterized protein n=1 Tax=Otus sunia TaxID=257818 RepID=A0A8C8B1D9_9STRI